MFNEPIKLVLTILLISSYVSSCNNFVLAIPALFINPYTSICLSFFWTSVSSLISKAIYSWLRFWLGKLEVTFSRSFLFLPMPIILKPSFASTLAKLDPKPLDAPVIKIEWP